MGNDAQLEKVDQYLQVLLTHAQDSMGEQGGALAGTVQAIQAEYDSAVLTLADTNASADAKKYAKDVTDSIGKNLPNLTKGVLTAASAFQKGDYMNGSAGIMDICAPAAPCLSECVPTNVASRSIVRRFGAPASAHARSRARACAARNRSSPSGSPAI